jgi:hypothetical protein
MCNLYEYDTTPEVMQTLKAPPPCSVSGESYHAASGATIAVLRMAA